MDNSEVETQHRDISNSIGTSERPIECQLRSLPARGAPAPGKHRRCSGQPRRLRPGALGFFGILWESLQELWVSPTCPCKDSVLLLSFGAGTAFAAAQASVGA